MWRQRGEEGQAEEAGKSRKEVEELVCGGFGGG